MSKLGMALATGAIVTVVRLMVFPTASSNSADQQAQFAASTLNATAPHQIDPYTTFTGAKSDRGTVEIDLRLDSGEGLNGFPDAINRRLTAASCGQKLLSDLLSQGGVVRYDLTTTDGRIFTPVTVASCNANSRSS